MILALILLTNLLAQCAASAEGQAQCGNRAEMVENLVNKYHEMQMGIGLRVGGSRLLEIWANCFTGTWTILKSYPDGTACVMAVGVGWQGVGCQPGQPTSRLINPRALSECGKSP